MGDSGFWVGLVGAIVALSGIVFQFIDRQRTARQDQVSYLSQRVADLERACQLCEMRNEELREELLHALARRSGGKARRKRVAV